MRIQLIVILLSISTQIFGNDDVAIQTLIKNYVSIMDEKKIELIEDVFTKNFIQDSGGKKELIKKINMLPVSLNPEKADIKWSKSKTKEFYLVKFKKVESTKSHSSLSEFTIVKEDGKLKIDGTLSDGN